MDLKRGIGVGIRNLALILAQTRSVKTGADVKRTKAQKKQDGLQYPVQDLSDVV